MKSIFFSIAAFASLSSFAARAQMISGVVKHGDGSPAAGAPVAIVSQGEGMVEVREGKLKWDKQASIAAADAEGRFSIEKPKGYYSLASADDYGYGCVSSSRFDAAPPKSRRNVGRG